MQGGHFGYRGRGRRGGRPFRGAGRGRFGQHGPRLKGTPAQASLTTPAHGSTAPVNPPPPRMAWCELCRVDCNTPEILEQHKNGKRHKKNLQKHEELQKFNKFITEQHNVQNPSSDVQPSQAIQPEKVEGSAGKQDSFPSQALAVTNNHSNKTEAPKKEDNPEASTVNLPEEPHRNSRDGQYQSRGRGLKRKMRGGRGGKYVRTNEGFKKPIELPKPKEAIPLICELCNVKCESQVVLQSHLAGKKHLANVKRYNGHRALYGEAGLQELYPSSFNNPSSSPSIVPQGQQGVSSDPQIVLAQLLTYVLAQAQAQAQAQAPGQLSAEVLGRGSSEAPAAVPPSASGPSQDIQYQHNSQTQESCQDGVIVEGESKQQSIATESKAENESVVCGEKDSNPVPPEDAATAVTKCEVVSSVQAVQPGLGNDQANPE